MSFFKRLFGGGKADEAQAAPKELKSRDHNGFTIRATPFKDGAQWQLSGVIEKEIGGVLRSQTFIRADKFNAADEAADFALVKGVQIIEEQGEGLFRG